MRSKVFILFIAIFLKVSAFSDIPKGVILYSSDNMDEFLAFSTFFGQDLKNETVMNVLHEHHLNSLWLKNSPNIMTSQEIDDQIESMANELKTLYERHEIVNLIARNLNCEKIFLELIKGKKINSNSKLLSKFLFWSAVSEIQSDFRTKDNLYLYQNEASLIEKSVLESQLDPKTLKLIQEPISLPVKKMPYYVVQQKFTQSGVTKNIYTFPSIENIKKSKFDWSNYSYLVIVFWSKKNSLLQVKLVQTSNFRDFKKTQYYLASPDKFSDISKKLTFFFQKANK